MRARLAKLPPGMPGEAAPQMPSEARKIREPSAEEIYRMIAEAAYYRAEKRGFTPGLEDEDWREAEYEVHRQLQARI